MIRKAVESAKRYYQYVLSLALIVLVILTVYAQDLEILVNEALQDEAFTYIFLVPFFAGILFYLKKDMVKASLDLEKCGKKTRSKYLDELVGVVLCLIAFLVYWYGSYTFYPLEYHIFSLPIFILGVTVILFDLKVMLVLLLPILFLFFSVPPPAEFIYSIGGTMASFNTQASYTLLKALSLPVGLSTSYGPPMIMLTSSNGAPASFAVDLPCSGIYSFTAFSMFAAFLVLVISSSIPRKVGVVLLGLATFEVVNVARITTTIAIAYEFGVKVAMNLFHNVAGLLLIFIGMLLTLFMAEKVLKVQVTSIAKRQAPCPKCETNSDKRERFCFDCGRSLSCLKTGISKEFWAKLFLLLLGCLIVTFCIHAPTFVVAQGPKGVAYTSNWAGSTDAFPNITGYRPIEFLYRDTNFESLAHQDASLWYVYVPISESQSMIYVDVGVAGSISNLHNWEVCLVSWQTAQGQYPLVSVLNSRDVQLLQDVPIIARYFTFEGPSPYNYTQVTLYWYEQATFNTGVTAEQKFVRISLIALAQSSTNRQQLEDELLPVGQAVASYWEPLQSKSLISLGVPMIQSLLVFSVALVLFMRMTQYFSGFRRKATNQRLFANFASADEKAVLEAVLKVAKEKKVIRTQDIEEALKRNMGKSLGDEDTLAVLRRLEEYDFVKRDIVSFGNGPLLVWKV
jgi:exosortase